MKDNADFYTITMAKVYENQGHFEKAIKIYKHILENEPDRIDVSQALTVVEQKKLHTKKRNEDELVALFEKWIELSLTYDKLNTLRLLKKVS